MIMGFRIFEISASMLQALLCTVLTINVLLCASVVAEPLDKGSNKLLDESEYRAGLEEVVVIGKRPRWQEPEQQWRPERFELPKEPPTTARIQWFPEYDKDERDAYQGVRDRTGEKAEFKIFEWKF